MSSIVRHNWIEQALSKFKLHFNECRYVVPDNIRVSVGFTKSPSHVKALGQCIDKAASKDGHYEMFISPIVGKHGNQEIDRPATVNILETIAHELIHATVGNEAGHRGAFAICAEAVGFIKPWRYTPAGPGMLARIESIISEQGLFPTGAITLLKKPQGKSLVKCMCEGCDYVAYITSKQLEKHGTPICPDDMEAMWCE